MELKDININRIIRESIEKILNESSSISDDVLNANEYIFSHFLNGEYRFQYTFNDLGIIEVNGIPMEIDNLDVKLDGRFDIETMTITLPIPFYNGEIYVPLLKKVVQHELEHSYQILQKKNNGDYKNRYNAIYNQAIETFGKEDSNYYDKELARYLYCCSTFEQDAFVNELYVDLKNSSPYTNAIEFEIIRNSNAFKAYRTIVDVKYEMKDVEGNGGYRRAFDKYNSGFKYKWLIQLGFNAENRMKAKIKNVVKKARNEMNNGNVEGHVNLDAIFD